MQSNGTAVSSSAAASAAQGYFRVADVAARFGVDSTTVYRQIKAGKLQAIRIGRGRGTVRVSAAALAEYEQSITDAAVESAGLTIDTPLGSVDLVAIERCRSGNSVKLTAAETAFLALLKARATAVAA